MILIIELLVKVILLAVHLEDMWLCLYRTRGVKWVTYSGGDKAFVPIKKYPKNVEWNYFINSSKKMKHILDLPTSGGNWNCKFFFAGSNWSHTASTSSKNYHAPFHFCTPCYHYPLPFLYSFWLTLSIFFFFSVS